jgi:hypothetical protein
LGRPKHRIAFRSTWVAVALALGCTSAPPRPTTVIAKVPEHIVILPLNVPVAMPSELEPESPAVWNALEAYLRAQGSALKTLAFPAARGLWVASIRDAQAAAKQNTKPGFDDAARIFVAKLKPYAEFDAVIIPSLYLQRAALSGPIARWDGVERALEIDTGHGIAPLPADAAIEGAVPAVSLHAVVLDAQGTKLQETRTGLVLLARARLSSSLGEASYSFLPRRTPFEDRAQLTESIAKALSPFLTPLTPPPADARHAP